MVEWKGLLVVATLVAAATAGFPGRSLEPNGQPIKDSDLTWMDENENRFDQWESIAERKKSCRPTISCTLAGGYCVKSRGDCNGTIDPEGCKGKKKCKCCIPDQTTPEPWTCPDVSCAPCSCTTEDQTTPEPWTSPDVSCAPCTTEDQTTPEPWTCPDVSCAPCTTEATTTPTTTSTITTSTPTTTPITTPTTTSTITTSTPTTTTSCPESEGFLMSPDMNECFKAIRTEKKKWTEVDSMCKSLELVFAEPNDHNAAWLQRTLFEKYGEGYYYLGARGTGSVFKWLSNDQELPSTSTLWMPGEPQSVSSGSYLFIAATDSYLKTNPGKPYRDGSGYRNYICEHQTIPAPVTTVQTTLAPVTTIKPATNCPGVTVHADQKKFCPDRSHYTWQAAVDYCRGLGLKLAEPKDLINVATKVVEAGESGWFWIGGKGTGSHQVWLNGTVVDPSLSVWITGYPKTATTDYLLLGCHSSSVRSGKVLRTDPITTYSGYALCETI